MSLRIPLNERNYIVEQDNGPSESASAKINETSNLFSSPLLRWHEKNGLVDKLEDWIDWDYQLWLEEVYPHSAVRHAVHDVAIMVSRQLASKGGPRDGRARSRY